jgi:HPr kinase/phosphorylase
MNRKSIAIGTFYEKYRDELDLELLAGEKGLKKVISLPEIERPGLALTGYLKGTSRKRLLVFGRVEMDYLKELPPNLRLKRLKPILLPRVPAVIISRKLRPPLELVQMCDAMDIPLLRSPLATMDLLGRLMALLTELFAPSICCHGALVEVFGLGLLIQGDSAVGKSEAALGLIERGHRLIADDVVIVRKIGKGSLEGFGSEMCRHHMEVRGIGIINVSHLYGAACVAEKKSLDIVVKLEVWDDSHFYDRAGLEEKTIPILGISVPSHVLPVKPGRDVVLLLETIALNHRLKMSGYHAARELDHNLLVAMEGKSKKYE